MVTRQFLQRFRKTVGMAGICEPPTSAGIIRMPCSKAAIISKRTKSSGFSSRSCPLSSLAVSQSFPLITATKASQEAMVFSRTSRQMLSGFKRIDVHENVFVAEVLGQAVIETTRVSDTVLTTVTNKDAGHWIGSEADALRIPLILSQTNHTRKMECLKTWCFFVSLWLGGICLTLTPCKGFSNGWSGRSVVSMTA